MKELAVVGRIYRGIAVLETMEGFLIIGEDGRHFPFNSRDEAEAFVDAWFLAKQRVRIVGEAPAQ